MSATLLKKLKYKAGTPAFIKNLPAGIDFNIEANSNISKQEYGFVLCFVQNKATLATELSSLIKAVIPTTVIWIAYPKKSSGIPTDITRDSGWDILTSVGYRPVSQVSIDSIWSALRIKPLEQVKSSEHAKHQVFEAVIEGDNGGAWVAIPFDTEKVFSTKGQVKVKATFDDHPYRGSIANMGSGSILGIKKDIREAIGKQPGDIVKVVLEKDVEERKVDIPKELQQLLDKNTDLKSFYESLSFTNRKEYAVWISSAKREETKTKRIEETARRLKEGIKNPFVK